LDSLVKERLTGAIILVVLIVLLVPELLSGPSRSAPAPQAAATSSEEPPLRSYTIDLADESHTAATSAGTSDALPQTSGPAQPPGIVERATAETPTSEQPAAAGSSAEAVRSAPETSSPAQHDTPKEQPQPAVQRQTATASAQRAPIAAADKASSSGGWMVQLGVFANRANADRLAQELKSRGFHAQVSENSAGGRLLWRVRAGPVAERTAAEQLSARLRAAGHAGSVVPK
jgi:DedD protein